MTPCSFEPICAHCASEEIQDDPSTVCNLPGKGTYCLNQAAPAKEVTIFIYFHVRPLHCHVHNLICFEFGEGFYKTGCGVTMAIMIFNWNNEK